MKLLPFSAVGLTGAALALFVGFAGTVSGHPAAASNTSSGAPATATEPVQLSRGVQDILKLSHAKVNDEVTVAFIKNGDRRFDLTASEIVYLRQEGVSDRVLATMLGHQPEMPAPTPAAMEASASATAAVASAPQYVTEPNTTAVMEMVPSSTVYVGSAAPAYYSFYDPWPYGYSGWPYYWGWSYPYFSFGWYWGGGYYYGYHGGCWDDDHHNDGNHNHSQAHNGNQQPADGSPTRVPPTRDGSASGQTATLAASERPSAGMNQTASTAGSRSAATRSARGGPAGRTTSAASNGGTELASAGTATASSSPGRRSPSAEQSTPANRTVASRTSANQVASVSAAGSQSARPTSTWSGAASDRSVATRPAETQGSVQLARGNSARPTSTWSAGASQGSVSRPTLNQNGVAAAPSSRVSTGRTTTWSQAGGQTVNRYVARPTTSYQRSGASYSPRASGNGGSYSRPSMSAPARSTGSSSAVRSGGSYGGGGGRSMSSGGGSRGGGGGGRSR